MGEYIDPVARKRAIIENAKRLASQQKEGLVQTSKKLEKIEFIPPEEATNKIRLICDNSGSMSSPVKDNETKMEAAKRGIVEFLRNCTPNKDAVAIHLLCSPYSYYDEDDNGATGLAKIITNSELCTDLIKLALNVDSEYLRPTGGTPLYQTIKNAQEAKPAASRYVAFSDGEPNNFIDEEEVISTAKKAETPIDTVFFGAKTERGHDIMKRLADRTGGIFLCFDPDKGVDFKTAFKYLAPAKRLMLMNEDFKKKLEAGEIKI